MLIIPKWDCKGTKLFEKSKNIFNNDAAMMLQ